VIETEQNMVDPVQRAGCQYGELALRFRQVHPGLVRMHHHRRLSTIAILDADQHVCDGGLQADKLQPFTGNSIAAGLDHTTPRLLAN
jgi:hypothetical protein